MKINKGLVALIIAIGSMTTIMGCDTKAGERVNDRYVTDNSDKMPVVRISEQQYTLALNNYITPLVQDANALKIQALQIKNGMADRSEETVKIDTWITNAEKSRDSVYDLLEPESRSNDKQNLLNAIDKYCAELRDYKILLEQDSIKASTLQQKADQVQVAIDTIRTYSK